MRQRLASRLLGCALTALLLAGCARGKPTPEPRLVDPETTARHADAAALRIVQTVASNATPAPRRPLGPEEYVAAVEGLVTGRERMRQKAWKEAFAAFERTLTIGPSDWRTALEASEAARLGGLREMPRNYAYRASSNAVGPGPRSVAETQLGLAYALEGEKEAAAGSYDDALSLRGDRRVREQRDALGAASPKPFEEHVARDCSVLHADMEALCDCLTASDDADPRWSQHCELEGKESRNGAIFTLRVSSRGGHPADRTHHLCERGDGGVREIRRVARDYGSHDSGFGATEALGFEERLQGEKRLTLVRLQRHYLTRGLVEDTEETLEDIVVWHAPEARGRTQCSLVLTLSAREALVPVDVMHPLDAGLSARLAKVRLPPTERAVTAELALSRGVAGVTLVRGDGALLPERTIGDHPIF